MTETQLTLARQFAEAVGWEIAAVEKGWVQPPNDVCHSLDWLYTGDGLLAVKAEMAKRGVNICSGPGLVDGTWMAWMDSTAIFFRINEPLAVLACAAVAAMKGGGSNV